MLKLLERERELDGGLRKRIECEIGEEFRRERGTTDGLFAQRQLVEKIRNAREYYEHRFCRRGEGIKQQYWVMHGDIPVLGL